MAKKISDEAIDKLKKEGGARVITKRRATPVVEEKAPEPEQVNLEPLVKAIVESNNQVIHAIKSREVIVDPRPMVKNIHISNIERDKEDRIESADLDVTYEEIH